ncbi:alpha-galactosidase [soil metagenome]
MPTDPSAVPPSDGLIVIDAGTAGLVLAMAEDGSLRQIGFGPGETSRRRDLPIDLYPLAYPTFGEEPLREPALRVTHGDGVTSTRLRVVSTSQRDATEGTGREQRVELADRVAPLVVTLAYRTWPVHGIIEQWVEVANTGDTACTLHRAVAAAPALAGGAPYLTHWGGGWAGEWTETTEALGPGTKTVASAGGVRSSLTRAPVVLVAPDGPVTETTGLVGAATVLWGGDVRFDAEVCPPGQFRLFAGHQHRGAERVLGPGGRFVSPHVLWAWSDAGSGPTSRALHRFAREQVVRDGTRTRATVANTWEAMGFDLDPEGLAAQVDRAADLGAELFLLDDGWFGTSRPRDDDTTGLGDWQVDRRKFPDGLQPLIDHTVARGLRFGLWLEPEMVNPQSDLYDTHPDWVVAEPGRERREDRYQLVLDLCRAEVRAFVVDVIDRVLSEHRHISYLKWDANRNLTESASAALAPGRQSHLPLDRVTATWDVMAKVARRHPDVELMLCASGGGRADLGTLRYFHELWTSDNTDPVDRVRIQWGASHLLPPSVLGAHVTRWGDRPLSFACAVAMSGRFGFDLDLRTLTDEEWATCRDAVQAYHGVRELVQHGQLHRLVSPVGSTRAALGYLSDDGTRSVIFAYRLPGEERSAAPIVVPWLTSDHRIVDLTPGRSAAERIEAPVAGGLPWPVGDPPVASVVELIAR